LNLLRSKITKTGRRDVQKFIRYRLKSKITRDLKHSRIFNEADLQSVVYLHLRRYLSHDKRWKIFNQPYISKLWGQRKTINFFPDIVLAIKKPRISIELKEKRTVRKNRVMKDAKKLYKLKKQGVIRKGFIIYLYQNKNWLMSIRINFESSLYYYCVFHHPLGI